MIDTRPEMTRAQFDEAASFAYENHWLTGEDSFLHVPAVMQVEDWNVYGRSGNNKLTDPQRVLMMWSDLVGQTSNGGFQQFVDNYEHALVLAYQLIPKLGWPELSEKFDLAFREQAGDPQDPQPRQPTVDMWGNDLGDWPENRQRIVRHLAGRATRWRPWARKREIATFERFSDTILNTLYYEAVERGEISPNPERSDDVEEPVNEAADAFDDWFYLDETKAASRTFIGDYIVRNRDHLCRLSG